ncbi:hypothetical protein BH23BAC1_BH23BAC1_49780 [soil metagenome]
MQKITKFKIFKNFGFIIMFLLTAPLLAQDDPISKISIIPEPVTVNPGEGNFNLSGSTSILIPPNQPEVRRTAEYLKNKIQPATGFDLLISEASGEAAIQFSINSITDAQSGDEGYTLEANPSKIIIKANKPTGLFYGAQTLLQLLPQEIENAELVEEVEWLIPAVTISDYPRFGWRGFMLDVSRHFFSKETVKEIIDQKARYKFNRFHLHLTDDNGWRIEIKSLPKLTEIGAWRVERHGTWGTNVLPKSGEPATYGGFYTQEDMKEIIQYAKDRYIEILPEIDVPGHSMAALAAYPELSVTKDPKVKVNPGTNFATWHGNGKFTMHIDNTLNPTDENVYQFLDKVFTEIAQIFPFEYIHMGGDEAYKGYWERDAGVQAFMKKNNIKNVDELQSYFNTRVGKIITSVKIYN